MPPAASPGPRRASPAPPPATSRASQRRFLELPDVPRILGGASISTIFADNDDDDADLSLMETNKRATGAIAGDLTVARLTHAPRDAMAAAAAAAAVGRWRARVLPLPSAASGAAFKPLTPTDAFEASSMSSTVATTDAASTHRRHAHAPYFAGTSAGASAAAEGHRVLGSIGGPQSTAHFEWATDATSPKASFPRRVAATTAETLRRGDADTDRHWDALAGRSEAALLRRFVTSPFIQRRVHIGGGCFINTLVLNGPDHDDAGRDDGHLLLRKDRKTIVLTHGYGAGLGFWFANLDHLARDLVDPDSGLPYQIVAVDWLGMARSSRSDFFDRAALRRMPWWCAAVDDGFHQGTDAAATGTAAEGGQLSGAFGAAFRPPYRQWLTQEDPLHLTSRRNASTHSRPPAPAPPLYTLTNHPRHPYHRHPRPAPAPAASDSGVGDSEAYFVDALEAWRRTVGLDSPFVLAGHSLGGYLAAAYTLKHGGGGGGGGVVDRLLLVSPFGLAPLPARLRRATTDLNSAVDHCLVADSSDASTFRRRRPVFPATASAATPRIPWPTRLLLAGWARNLTPQLLLRHAGTPLGRVLARRAIARRFPRLSPADRAAVADYLHAISAAPPAGEYALHALMRVVVAVGGSGGGVGGGPTGSNSADPDDDESALNGGLFARSPMGPRLLHGLPGACRRVGLVFGDRDWGWDAATAALPLLREPCTAVRFVAGAGHHLCVDNPDGFLHAVRDLLRA
ncbi:Alpha/beta hydrolase domain-containing protein 4 [Cladochytrium tenue]|nr:Alpha/beta hydrolase domain-containing protein 4 [Cladochytrium tenue]